jgi:hypothetical protein
LSIDGLHLIDEKALAGLARLNPGSVAALENLDSFFGEDDDGLNFDFDD